MEGYFRARHAAGKILRIRVPYWINKTTHIHLEYVILIFSPQQQWLHERASLLHYTYIVCLSRRFHVVDLRNVKDP